MSCASFSMLDGPGEMQVNLLIQHIIVQDQDGQNNNKKSLFNYFVLFAAS
jgi:hypothetical protein